MYYAVLDKKVNIYDMSEVILQTQKYMFDIFSYLIKHIIVPGVYARFAKIN